MTYSRERRNEGMMDDAIASIGTTMTVAEHLLQALGGQLPDDVEGEILTGLQNLRESYDALTEKMNI